MSVRLPPTHVYRFSIRSRYSTYLTSFSPHSPQSPVSSQCRLTSSIVAPAPSVPITSPFRPRSRNNYFLDNDRLRSFDFGAKTFFKSRRTTYTQTTFEPGVPPKDNTTIRTDTSQLPHRRRKSQQNVTSTQIPTESTMAPDMPSVMTSHAAQLPANSIRRLYSTLLALSKPRLSFLIVLTTTSAYSLYPVPEMLSPSLTETPSLSALTLLFLTIGTSLTCASANTFNMLYEPKWDAMMSRTKNRPLVRGLISSRGAAIFGVVAGITGVVALYYGVNPTVAFIGGLKIFL